jgi:hypothetical protein
MTLGGGSLRRGNHPGWLLRGMIREMLPYHIQVISDPHQRVCQARAFLDKQ